MLKRKSFMIAALVVALSLSGCAKRAEESSHNTIEVVSSPGVCNLSKDSIQAGTIVFRATNASNTASEFYILEADGKKIVTEVENIGPNLSRDLVTQLDQGTFYAMCVPANNAEPIKTKFTVTQGDNVATQSEDQEALTSASAEYSDWVQSEIDQLLIETKRFVALYLSGNTDGAKAQYPYARTFWERIEPVAESFGDIDPLLDLREADLVSGEEWTGWHLFEKDLWQPKTGYTSLTRAQKNKYSDLLIKHTEVLGEKVEELEYKPFQMGNGAKALLDEIATGKVTGEEEIWSGTDLWDFQANLEGAEKIFRLFETIVAKRDPNLAKELNRRFSEIYKLLDGEKIGGKFRDYKTVPNENIKVLAAAVDALGNPISKLTSVVVQ
jgi:iron uptake system component EfeO